MVRMKNLIKIFVLGLFFILIPSKVLAINVSFPPPPAEFYEPVIDSGGYTYNKALLVHQRENVVPLEKIQMLLCRSDIIVQNDVEYYPQIYVGFVDMTGQPDYYAIKNLPITAGSNGNYYSRCALVASYDFLAGGWGYHSTVSWSPTIRLTGQTFDICPYDLSNILAVQDLTGTYYNPESYTKYMSISSCPAGTLNFTISPYSFRGFARGVWNIGLVPVLGDDNPAIVYPYHIDYLHPNNTIGEFTRTSSTSPCKVDLVNGTNDYYGLICDDETSFFVDLESGVETPTNEEYAIYIPNTNDPCSTIHSVNYALYDTQDNLLCTSRGSDFPSSNRVPDVPLLSLIPPEADWGAFDFLKTPFNSFITALNSFITFGNNFSENFLNFFIPPSLVFKQLGISLKSKFSEKIDITGFGEFMNKIGQAMGNKNNYTPPAVTSSLMGVNVNLVDWGFVSDNISLIRGFLNGSLIFAFAFVVFNILKKATET